MNKEIWKDIQGYEGLYQVSNLGNIFCVRTNSIMKCSKARKYYKANLYKEGKIKTRHIHRLVAEAFIPNPDNLPCVNHIDCNPLNNRLDNLEWCDYKYNNNHKNHEIKRHTTILINEIKNKFPNNEIINQLIDFYKTL